jgi:hypothetical protein
MFWMKQEMATMPMGAVAMQPKMAEGASLFRPTLAPGIISKIHEYLSCVKHHYKNLVLAASIRFK